MNPHASLGRLSIRSAFVQLSGQGLQVLLMLASAIVLARLIPPREFGLFAMVVSISAMVGALRGFGLHYAAVQAPELSLDEAGALFWINLKLTTLSALLIAAMAPVLVWFYGQEQLLALTLVAAVAVFLHGTCVLHEALLMRHMRFGRLQGSELGSQLAAFLVAALAALSGLGVWALVLQMLTYGVTRSLTVFALGPWRPARGGRPPGLARLLVFGRHYSIFFALSSAGRRLDRIVVGYFHGATPLGLYENAFRWSHHPIHQLFPPLSRVAVAGLSRLQNDARGYASAARRALLPTFSLVVPALAYLALEADFVIPTLLGAQWTGAVPYFRILCLAAIAGSIRQATNWLYLSIGDTKRQMHWSAVSLPFLWAGALIGVLGGPIGVAVGYTVAMWALTFPGLAYCLRTSPLAMRDFLSTFTRPATASALAAAALFASRWATDAGPLARGALFTIVYAVVWRALPGGKRGADELFDLARRVPGALRREPVVATVETT